MRMKMSLEDTKHARGCRHVHACLSFPPFPPSLPPSLPPKTYMLVDKHNADVIPFYQPVERLLH